MIHRIAKHGLFLALASVLSVSACKKEEKKEEAAKTQTTPEKAPEKTQEAPKPVEPAAKAPEAKTDEAATGDHFTVAISHTEPKPEDPVMVKFTGLTVVSAKFDAKNLEGATAELELDAAKMDSGIPKRDGHLASPDYLDAAKFPKISIKVADVKAKDGDVFTANATVGAHGMEKSWPVEFKVIERGEDGSITVEAEHTFSRLDFGIGKPEESVAKEAKATMRVTLKNS